jgi:hypothetical protein
MSGSVRRVAIAAAVLAITGVPALAAAAGGGCGRTLVEALAGPSFNGVVPAGRATADESQLLCGGTTILTVEVANVNLADGTGLDVSLDFRPLGTLTLSGMHGVLAVDLGRFGVSNDEVRVSFQGHLILIGPFFR